MDLSQVHSMDVNADEHIDLKEYLRHERGGADLDTDDGSEAAAVPTLGAPLNAMSMENAMSSKKGRSLSADDIAYLKEQFDDMDVDGDGYRG